MSSTLGGGGNPFLLPFLLSEILVNAFISSLLRRSSRSGKSSYRKLLLGAGILLNVAVLLYVKYYNFFLENVSLLFGFNYSEKSILVPLGVSFLTFQQIAHLVDAYRQELPDYSLLEYACYVSFFPKIISGPITLSRDFLPQLKEPDRYRVNWVNLADGLQYFILGMGKKVLLGDLFGACANYGYSHIAQLNSLEAVVTVLAFSLQIYFDFSGYSDMALGLARLFNFALPINFDSPYKALNIKSFWACWHITLTNFFTRYIYIPLGGSRRGRLRTYLNILLIFFISGLWHGASWGFVLWGLLHGIAMVIYRIFAEKIDRWHPALAWLLTFSFVSMAWVPFRAARLSDAFQLWRRCFNLERLAPLSQAFAANLDHVFLKYVRQIIFGESGRYLWLTGVGLLLLALLVVLNMKNTHALVEAKNRRGANALWLALILSLSILSFANVGSFIYAGF